MERVDLGHGRGWLTPAPAASIRRIDADLGRPLDINDAGRTWDEQAKRRADYLAGRGSYALPAGSSIHELGAAIDSDDLGNADFVTWLEEHGWFRTALARGEWWHAEYDPTRDQHRNEPAHTIPAVPTPQEESTMALGRIRVAQKGNKNGKTFIALPNPRAHADPKQKPYIAIVETATTKGVEWEIDARNQFTYNYIERYFEGVNQG